MPMQTYTQASVLEELEKSVFALYLESDAMFRRPVTTLACISSSTETVHVPDVGVCVDVRTTTPIAFDFAKGGDIMWRETNAGRGSVNKTCAVVRCAFEFGAGLCLMEDCVSLSNPATEWRLQLNTKELCLDNSELRSRSAVERTSVCPTV